MKKYLIIILLAFFVQVVKSQKDTSTFPLIVSVFNNSTLLPGSGKLGFINTPVHPGIRIGTLIIFRNTEKYDLYETFNAGYYYHRLSQSSFQLYSELAYRYKFCKGFGFDAQAMIGYMLVKPDIDVFEKTNDGSYKQKVVLRSQFIGGVGLGFSYKLQKLPARIFLNYQFYLQTPFVKNYVPMLPNSALHLGAFINL